MKMQLHTLNGCAPSPLANYLKALGILRLIAEQLDSNVRGWWQDEHFCLMTNISREEIEAFFLHDYEPTPMLSPWNKGCGFFKANDPGLWPLENSIAKRFSRFREGIVASRSLLDSVANADATIRAIKARTKTNKSFQTVQQRELLENSGIFEQTLDVLAKSLSLPDTTIESKKTIEAEIDTIKFIVAHSDSIPKKPEVDRLKESLGYKRLLNAADRRFKSLKSTLIPDCQRCWRGSHSEWLSAAVVLSEDGTPTWPSLLGTGGNDGNLDFTNNFMQRLVELFQVKSDLAPGNPNAAELLQNALWCLPSNCLANSSVGQFQPGAAGGAFSSSGAIGDGLVNPWVFVLMMVGSILFSSRATKRFSPNETSHASAPFAVRAHAAGHASPGNEKAQRGEQWMPLWSRPTRLDDLGAMFGEARLQLERQAANRPVDVARAISRLGVARGIEAFTRFGYLERNGQSTLAVPLGRVNVRQHPLSYLVDDLAPWLDRIQRRARDTHAPARLVHAEHRLADSVLAALLMDNSRSPSPSRWQEVLHAAVAIEAIQATGTAIDAGPIPGLRPEWIRAIDDGSPEVRLAIALGSAATDFSKNGWPIDPVRHHWLPLEPGRYPRFKKSDQRLAKDSRVVMLGRDALSDFSLIVERRLIEAKMNGQRRLPLVSARGCSARLADIDDFISGEVDDEKIFSLSRALMAIRWDQCYEKHRLITNHVQQTPDEAWLMLRLASLPWPLKGNRDIPAERGIVRRLLAGDTAGATNIAIRRLRSAGIRPPLTKAFADSYTARRWAAALVFPISFGDTNRAAEILDPRLKGSMHV